MCAIVVVCLWLAPTVPYLSLCCWYRDPQDSSHLFARAKQVRSCLSSSLARMRIAAVKYCDRSALRDALRPSTHKKRAIWMHMLPKLQQIPTTTTHTHKSHNKHLHDTAHLTPPSRSTTSRIFSWAASTCRSSSSGWLSSQRHITDYVQRHPIITEGHNLDQGAQPRPSTSYNNHWN